MKKSPMFICPKVFADLKYMESSLFGTGRKSNLEQYNEESETRQNVFPVKVSVLISSEITISTD